MRGFIRMSGLVVAVLFGIAPGARAQGCVLCYTSLAGAGPGAMKAFEMAMFALLIPALTLFAGVFLFIYLRTRTAPLTLAALRTFKAARQPKQTPGIATTAEGRV